ncbi:irregular chiasm C-roughest protein-like [Tachypleus tridentatus]|uniref:irregular chiasm C-roughest protein-like n=1 Tax=Tachypleus tridentatus TaxID=6853 RepID=UPI003FD1A3C1
MTSKDRVTCDVISPPMLRMRKRIWIVVVTVAIGISTDVTSKHIERNMKKTVPTGATVSLPCSLNTPGGSIQWLQNGQPVVLEPFSGKFWNISRDGIAALTIQRVSSSDEGVWECNTLAEDGSVANRVEILELAVIHPPEEPYLDYDNKRLPQGAIITLKEWQVLTLKCVTRNSSPAQRIQWFLETSNVSSHGKLFTEFLPGNETYLSWSLLSLNITRTFNRRELVCFVFHESWPQPSTAGVSLNVLYDPTFSISRIPDFGTPVIEGMFVSLRCDIDSNPPSDPLWLKEERPQVSPEGYLNFTFITREHAGWYKCITEHLFGYFGSFGYFLNVRYGAEIVEEPPKEVEAETGSSIDLECQADGRPSPSYCWARVRDADRIEGIGIGKDLHLDRIHYEDAGVYKCIASNNIGYRYVSAQTKDVIIDVKG